MGKLDEQKTYIDLLKGIFYILITAMIGLGSFIFLHYEGLSNAKVIFLVVFLIIIAYVNVIFLSYLFKKIKELKDL